MAYSEELADRIRDVIGARSGVTERRMFGGVVWMIDGNMAVGTLGEDLMVRVGAQDTQRALTEPHVGPMDFTGKPLKGFVRVAAEGIADGVQLAGWIDVGADYATSLPPK
ncbi:TfoX/Sxy family protein [Paraconexibacter sp.]|uniref:TfoX/Sxy family protein n=1 Tax=Paraconexibacter sp. TaxID=2949640 RepID=UPI00356B0E7B